MKNTKISSSIHFPVYVYLITYKGTVMIPSKHNEKCHQFFGLGRQETYTKCNIINATLLLLNERYLKNGIWRLYLDLCNCKPGGQSQLLNIWVQHISQNRGFLGNLNFYYVNFQPLLNLWRSHWFWENEKRKESIGKSFASLFVGYLFYFRQ